MSNTYSYNGLGQRSGKVDSTGTFSYTRNSDAIDAPVVSDGAARYVQGATGLLSESRNGTSKYYHADALGSTRAITNTSGVVTDTKATDAFGITYSAGTSGSTPTPFGFVGSAGYQSDSDTGLMLLGHRYYDASVGRFLSRDPIQDGTNWYTYCGNDPVNAVDPAGLGPKKKKKEPHDKHKWMTVTATEFGGSSDSFPVYSAYPPYDDKGRGVLITDDMPGAAIPAPVPPGTVIEVNNPKTGKTVTVQVIDIGPETTNDRYWSGTGKPKYPSHAIDLTPKTIDDLGLPKGGGTVQWRFPQ